MMVSLRLPAETERRFQEVVQKDYSGDVAVAVAALLELHDKYGWKEQLLQDVESVRAEVRRQGGVTADGIGKAVKAYRRQRHSKGF